MTGRDAVTGSLPLPGLDPTRSYAVRVRPEAGLPAVVQHLAPAWWERALADDGIVVPGVGADRAWACPCPVIGPAQGYLLDARAL